MYFLYFFMKINGVLMLYFKASIWWYNILLSTNINDISYRNITKNLYRGREKLLGGKILLERVCEWRIFWLTNNITRARPQTDSRLNRDQILTAVKIFYRIVLSTLRVISWPVELAKKKKGRGVCPMKCSL